MNENISIEEKIDYIYSTLRKQEMRAKIGMFLKWGFRIFMLAYLYYFISFMLPAIIENMKEALTPAIPSIGEMNIDKDEILKKAKEVLGY